MTGRVSINALPHSEAQLLFQARISVKSSFLQREPVVAGI